MSKKPIIVAIDGPPAAGKSTAASTLARELGFIHLNSGALYRAVALLATRDGLDLNDEVAIAKYAQSVNFEFVVDSDGVTALLVNGSDYGSELRTEAVGDLASRIGTKKHLREVLTQVQRDVGQKHSLVLEGRDAGTVVFPAATVKFYLDASVAVRAERRFMETKEVLQAKGQQIPDSEQLLMEIRTEMQRRDERDSSRVESPLSVAEDAVVLDTSNMSIAEVVGRMKEVIASVAS